MFAEVTKDFEMAGPSSVFWMGLKCYGEGRESHHKDEGAETGGMLREIKEAKNGPSPRKILVWDLRGDAKMDCSLG